MAGSVGSAASSAAANSSKPSAMSAPRSPAAGEVLVEGRRLDLELRGQRADRQPLDAVAGEEPARDVEDHALPRGVRLLG